MWSQTMRKYIVFYITRRTGNAVASVLDTKTRPYANQIDYIRTPMLLHSTIIYTMVARSAYHGVTLKVAVKKNKRVACFFLFCSANLRMIVLGLFLPSGRGNEHPHVSDIISIHTYIRRFLLSIECLRKYVFLNVLAFRIKN